MATRMKAIYSIILLLFVGFACDRQAIKTQDGKLITHSLCKYDKSLIFDTDESCAQYSYNESTETLYLKHINTAFNCCPEKLYCNITIGNDTIYLEELERKQECECNCLYDMEVEVYGVKEQSYVVKYIEPYLYQEDELIFDINLAECDTGSYCVQRLNYPWGL
jgi:hypothetical protein